MIRILNKPQTQIRLILETLRVRQVHRPPTTCPGGNPNPLGRRQTSRLLAAATLSVAVSRLLHPHVRQIAGETAVQAVADVLDTSPTASTYPQAFVELAQRAGPLADRVIDIAFTHPVTDTDDHKLCP